MKELRRLLAICVLTASMLGVALADGGDTQGPPATPPTPPECTQDCSSTEASTTTAQSVQASTGDIATTAEMIALYLATSIF